jgi:phosphate/sulfate permease
LIAEIIWNLAISWFGLPASSSYTLIGSIIGVGITNACYVVDEMFVKKE